MYALGVDLGTVYTAAATWRDGHAEIVSLGSRAATIPSVVLLREDASFLTGEAANRRALMEPGRVAREFKRRFGDSTPIMLGGTPHSPEALMGRLLQSVVSEVTAQQGEPPVALCVCHPANWGPYKTDLLQQAIRMADLNVPVTLSVEPVAAAAYYARQQRVDDGSLVAVYDLGGGTFDAAVVRKTGNSFEIIGRPEGIEHLGGADFDAAVFEHVRSVVGEPLTSLDDSLSSTVAAVARLREECTSAKETLSSDTDTTIPVLLPSFATEVRITRGELERMVRPSLYDTISALNRAIRSAGVTAPELHSVLLIGGSSRMPLVAQLVGAEVDRPVAVDAHPKHAVALGAAWIAGAQKDAEAGPTVAGAPSARAAAPSTSVAASSVAASAAAAAAAARTAREPAPPTAAGGLAAGSAVAADALHRTSAGSGTAAAAVPPAPTALAPGRGTSAADGGWSGPGAGSPGHAPAAPPPSGRSDGAGGNSRGAAAGAAAAGAAGAAAANWPPQQPFSLPGAPQPVAPQSGGTPFGNPQQSFGGPQGGPPQGPGENGAAAAWNNGARPPAPPQAQQAAAPPGASGPPPEKKSLFTRPWGVAIAAAAAVLLVVAPTAWWVGHNLGTSKDGAAAAATSKTPSPTANGSKSPSASGSATTSPSASTSGSAANPPDIYTCPTNADAAIWACFKSAKVADGKINILYTTNFTLSNIQDAAHYHFHMFLANPGLNNTTQPVDAIMQHVPNAGSWFIIYSGAITTIDNNTDRGGKKEPIDVSKYSLFCVRVASGLHGLAYDKKGGFRTGNCVRMTAA